MADWSPIALALGRIPSGLFVFTTGIHGGSGADRATGMLSSFVQQVGFEPPVILAGVHRDRDALDIVRRTGRFCVSVLDGNSKHLLGHFASGFAPGVDPFEGLKVATHEGVPYLPEAVAWMACEVVGEGDWTDHVAVAGKVIAGDRRDDAAPSVHVRVNGLSY